MNLKSQKAVFPGSFDPPTVAHMDIIRQAAEIFSELVLAVAVNSSKTSFFPLNTRKKFLQKMVAGFKNVKVASFEGLTASFACEIGAGFLVRGLRNEIDFVYEKELAAANDLIGNGIKTVFFLAGGTFCFVSSSLVREAIQCGGFDKASRFVPDSIFGDIKKHLKGRQ